MSEWLRIISDPSPGSGATHKLGLGPWALGLGLVPSLCVRWAVGGLVGLVELKGFDTGSAFDDFVS